MTLTIPTHMTLPYPPSVNHYWRQFQGRAIISRKGREYRKAVERIASTPTPLRGRLAIRIVATMPDRRRRDIDNILKTVLDAMAHAGVFEDDSQIDRLVVERGKVSPPGRLDIEIMEANRG